MRLYWPFLMVLSFGIFDMVSTYLVYDKVGTFSYETGALPALFYSIGGIAGVVLIKILLTTACAFLLFVLARKIWQFDRMCTLLCIGASIVGLMATISNLSGMLTGSTVFLFGVSIDIVAYAIFTLTFIVGMIDVVLAYAKHKPNLPA